MQMRKGGGRPFEGADFAHGADWQELAVPRPSAVEVYTIKKIQRRNLPLCQTFIAGDMDAMQGARKQLNIEIPS